MIRVPVNPALLVWVCERAERASVDLAAQFPELQGQMPYRDACRMLGVRRASAFEELARQFRPWSTRD